MPVRAGTRDEPAPGSLLQVRQGLRAAGSRSEPLHRAWPSVAADTAGAACSPARVRRRLDPPARWCFRIPRPDSAAMGLVTPSADLPAGRAVAPSARRSSRARTGGIRPPVASVHRGVARFREGRSDPRCPRVRSRAGCAGRVGACGVFSGLNRCLDSPRHGAVLPWERPAGQVLSAGLD